MPPVSKTACCAVSCRCLTHPWEPCQADHHNPDRVHTIHVTITASQNVQAHMEGQNMNLRRIKTKKKTFSTYFDPLSQRKITLILALLSPYQEFLVTFKLMMSRVLQSTRPLRASYCCCW